MKLTFRLIDVDFLLDDDHLSWQAWFYQLLLLRLVFQEEFG